MRISVRSVSGIFAIAALLMVGAGAANAHESEGVASTTLLQTGSSWDGVAYEAYPAGAPELTVLKLVIPPNFNLPWHTHPMPNAAYVLSGELTVEKKETGERKVLTAGQVLPEMVNSPHRGLTGDKGVVLIVFYAGVKGMPQAHILPTK